MAAEIQTPVCEATGLPLPILPTEPDSRARLLFEDYHHHFHPRRDPSLSHIDGHAVRYSRGQIIPRYLHDRYHQIFTGPPLPQTQDEKFRVAVLACAGVVPRVALDLSVPGQYREVSLDDDVYERLAAPRSIYVEKAYYKKDHEYDLKRRTIGKFFASYAMQQNVREILSESVIGQFLDDATTPERKKELGNFILKEALLLSIVPIAGIHQELAQNGFVLPARRREPMSVIRKFFTKNKYTDYHDELERRIAAMAA